MFLNLVLLVCLLHVKQPLFCVHIKLSVWLTKMLSLNKKQGTGVCEKMTYVERYAPPPHLLLVRCKQTSGHAAVGP